ncbi:MAG: septum site-determining protein MinC [Lachnospiraceae bacterium]|nr:septum site-determining protein MinC [Lachnospiraceae bacterium]
MKNAVRIKNTSGGMTVYLDAQMEFEELLSEIGKKFGESAKFFGNVKTVLSLEGRELSEEEEARIVDVITLNTQLDIVYLLDKSQPVVAEQEPQQEVVVETVKELIPRNERVVFYKRCIEAGEIIRADKDLVVFGNVSEDAVVMSTNSIYIFGGLYGEAYAGIDNGDDYVIAAMDFMPEKIGIGRHEHQGKKVSRWIKKSAFDSKIAYVKDKKIVTDQITKELLNSLV